MHLVALFPGFSRGTGILPAHIVSFSSDTFSAPSPSLSRPRMWPLGGKEPRGWGFVLTHSALLRRKGGFNPILRHQSYASGPNDNSIPCFQKRF